MESEEDAGSWRECSSFYATAEGLATLTPAVMWKIETMLKELEALAKEGCRQSVKAAYWIILAASSKM